MTLPVAQQQLKHTLGDLYDEREAVTIADWVMEKVTGLKKVDRILLRERLLSTDEQKHLEKYSEELLAHRPVQYVLGECWFCGLRFRVDERVLIPRPETEELVDWILHSPSISGCRLLDIGTGSGCISVSLKKRLQGSTVFACDISEAALSLAMENAADNDAPVRFFHLDILQSLSDTSGLANPSETAGLPFFDLIVSNPPYIPLRDRPAMRANILAFEPSQALFVEDEDPLIFYKAIAGFAQNRLSPGGSIFVELHEDFSAETAEVFYRQGFRDITVKKDLQGKDRMIRARIDAGKP